MFVFEVPISLHNDYHAHIHDIPVPDGSVLRFLWFHYQRTRPKIHEMGIVEACDWLIANADDLDFRMAMTSQRNFFQSHGG